MLCLMLCFRCPSQTAGVPHVRALASGEITPFMTMKLGLIELITVITGIVQICNPGDFHSNNYARWGHVMLEAHPVCISVWMSRRMESKPDSGHNAARWTHIMQSGKISSSNELNEFAMLYLLPLDLAMAKHFYLIKYVLMPSSFKGLHRQSIWHTVGPPQTCFSLSMTSLWEGLV